MKDITKYNYDPTKVYEPNKTLFGYLRVSSKVQLEEGNSIENQFTQGLKVSEQLNMEFVILNEEYCSTMSKVRQKLEQVKHGIRIGIIKNLWYYSRSRWTRDEIEDGLISRNYFRKFKTKVYEGESGTLRRLDSSQDRMLDRIFTTVQQFDREQRREVSISGKKHMSRVHGETGVFMGGTINFGFKNIDKRWEIEETESTYIKKIYQMYLQGISLRDIKTFLDTEGVRPRRSKTWSLGTLNTMLKNRVYVGEYTWKDKESGELFKIILPQIISHSMFSRVQKQITKNIKNYGNNMRKYDTLLSGVLTCSCGENITGQIKKTVDRKTYGCRSNYSKWRGKEVKVCLNTRTMNMDETDSLIISRIKSVVGESSSLKEKFKNEVMSKKGTGSKEITSEKKKIEKNIKSIDKQLETTIKSISINEVNHMLGKTIDVKYHEISNLLEEELIQLEDKKKSYLQEIDDLDNQKDWIDWVSKYGKDMEKRFEKPTSKLIEGIVEEIIVSPVMGKTREGKQYQRGHQFKVKFKLPIVNDSLEYQNNEKKSDGYTIGKGDKSVETQVLEVKQQGRPKKKSSKKKVHTNLLDSN